MRGKEFYSFEYQQSWLENGYMMLDPDLHLYKGRQYINDDKNIFGVFADSCPDRWGRRLMNRREELRAKAAGEKPLKLSASDYLLGVYDEARMGGLRFKTDLDGDFLSFDKEYATPPWTSLRELEQASIAFEGDDTGSNEKWLRQLLTPGSSLGGARPKASDVRSPFVFGLVRPRIYLPLHLNEADMSSVIAHEQAHIKCRDYIIKPVGYLLLMVHWFNPLIWLSYMLFCKDIELACDERVIRKYTPKQRADYSQALLNCSTDKHSVMVYPLSFGEVGVKSRVKSVLNYKKPTFWIGVAAIVAIVVMALCFLTSPKFKREETAIVEDYAGDYVVMQDYYELDDGRWACGDYTYTYRLVLTGSIKSNAASTSITYIVLSNTQDITFEQAHKASGLSSNIDDYFDPETAVIVAHIYDDK